MESEKKAKELFEKFIVVTPYKYQEFTGANYSAFENYIKELRQYALICIDREIELCRRLIKSSEIHSGVYNILAKEIQLKEDMRQEIEKL